MVAPGALSSSGEPFLHVQIVLDESWDDRVEAGIGGQAEGGRACRAARARGQLETMPWISGLGSQRILV
jgi:hypothetical protein